MFFFLYIIKLVTSRFALLAGGATTGPLGGAEAGAGLHTLGGAAGAEAGVGGTALAVSVGQQAMTGLLDARQHARQHARHRHVVHWHLI